MKAFFLCSIGPVQDFIATARKSRDLWYGSWLLSELSKAILHTIAQEAYDCEIVFPIVNSTPNSSSNIPNRIGVVFNTWQEDIPHILHQALNDRLLELAKEVLEPISDDLLSRDLAYNQIMNLPEFLWVAVEFLKDEPFRSVRQKAESLLAFRKNTRDFVQVKGLNQRKSSLDGRLESVIPESFYLQQNSRKLFTKFRAKQDERLSGVDLLKRLGNRNQEREFPSTSDVAAAPLLAGMKKEEAEAVIKKIKDRFDKNGFSKAEISENGALLFPSRIKELVSEEALCKDILKLRDDLLGRKEPQPYYSLFIADGDDMGKLIDSTKSISEHQNISKALSDFAADIPPLIEEHNGVCVYAGGEDILAYLPLHTGLVCAQEIERHFRNAFKKIDIHNQASLSGGLVIAHHLTPLHEILAELRSAERLSKELSGKNGLTIVLNKRGGSPKRITDKWGNLLRRIRTLIEYTKSDKLSNKTAYDLQKLLNSFPPEKTGLPSPEALKIEALSVLSKKREPSSSQSLKNEVKKQIEEWILKDQVTVRQLVNEMLVAKEFASAEKLADPEE